MPRAGLSDAQLVQRLLGATQQRTDVATRPIESQPPQGQRTAPRRGPTVAEATAAEKPSDHLVAPTAAEAAASSAASTTVHVAVQGCVHGELDKIYDACVEHEQRTGRKIDLLICCGDFQCIRNENDLNCMAVPQKYRTYGDFVQYFQGTKTAPYLTIFVGGNHEASNVLAEQYYGGFVAENIFYLGHSGVIEVCGLRIAGLSGIYHNRDYTRPYAKLPLPQQSVRDAYHVRKVEVEKLKHFAALSDQRRSDQGRATAEGGAVDIMISHDWPTKITSYGDEEGLLARKPYFRDDIAHAALGNPHTMELLHALRPRYWFAAHLHVYFTAEVPHRGGRSTHTNFIALDKCVHQSRQCLTFLDIPVAAPQPETAPPSSCSSGPSVFSKTICMDGLWADVIQQSNEVVRGQQDRVSNDFTFTDLLASPHQDEASKTHRTASSFPFRDTLQVIHKLGLSGHPLMASSSTARGGAAGVTGGGVLHSGSSANGGGAAAAAGAVFVGTPSPFAMMMIPSVRVGSSPIPSSWKPGAVAPPRAAGPEKPPSIVTAQPVQAKEKPLGSGEGFDWVEDTVAR